MDGVSIPANYVENFRHAYLTFQHQRVFDPVLEAVVPLKPLPPELEEGDSDFLGKPLPGMRRARTRASRARALSVRGGAVSVDC